jgi:hypothetical protein
VRTAFTAQTRAALLTASGVKLPKPVAEAITALETVAALRHQAPAPGARSRRALLDAADAMAEAAGSGTEPKLDTRPIVAARAAEMDDRDKADLIREAKVSAASRLLDITAEHTRKLISAVQDRHAELAAEFVLLAKQLPAGVDDKAALEAGEPVRSSYLACRDAHAAMAQLKETLREMDGPAPRNFGAIEQALLHIRDVPGLWDHYMRYTGARFPDYLGYVREGAEFWAPTWGQIGQRVAELREANRRIPTRADDPRLLA